MRLPSCAVVAAVLGSLLGVTAQDTTSASSQGATSVNSNAASSANTNTAPPATLTFSDVASTVPVLTTRSVSRTASIQTLSSVATVIRVSYTLTPSSVSASATTAAASATSTPYPHLDTRVDPTFGVLGVLLILTGLPTAFWGHKNRWSSFFLIGFYTLALTTIVLILKFGVLDAINPPSAAVRGMFLLASAVAGVVGGGLSIFFWKQTRYFIGAWGGFALALWIQCFQEGGIIRPIGFRWIFYVGCAVVGFVLCTIPKIHYNILLISTAIVGASATILGIDCFTTAGLKEFYLWNLGFMRLFPVFYNIGMPYPLHQTTQIELGLVAAVALMGGAVQFRMLGLLKKRLQEINMEQRQREEDAEIAAAERLGKFDEQVEEWEKRHGNRPGSAKELSSSGGLTPTATAHEGRPSSQFSLLNGPRSAGLAPATPAGARSGDYFAVPLQSPKPITPPADPSTGGISGRRQSIGALPVLDLGTDDLAGGAGGVRRDSVARLEDAIKANEDTAAARRREELRAEIEAIKRNIDQLKTEVVPSRPASVFLLDTDVADRRSRTVSFDALRKPAAAPHSAPLQPPPESEWDKYVRERKLFTPPSGVTPPIPSGTLNGRPMSVMLPDAVAEAVDMRKRRESMLEMGLLTEAAAVVPSRHSRTRTTSNGAQLDLAGDPSFETQHARERPTHSRHHSQGTPVILPPNKSVSPARAMSPGHPRVRTYEELQERHREKMRALQEPLRRAEAELAELEAAKSRWERSLQVERQVMERREAERRAAYERKQAGAAGVSKDKVRVSKRISKMFGADKSEPQRAPQPEEVEVEAGAGAEAEEPRPPREKRGHSTRDSAVSKVAAWQASQDRAVETARRSVDNQHRRQQSRQASGHVRQGSSHMQRSVAPN